MAAERRSGGGGCADAAPAPGAPVQHPSAELSTGRPQKALIRYHGDAHCPPESSSVGGCGSEAGRSGGRRERERERGGGCRGTQYSPDRERRTNCVMKARFNLAAECGMIARPPQPRAD